MESWRHMGAHFLDASSARSSYPLGFYLWEIWVKKPDLLEKFCICLCREPPGHYQPGLYFQLISRLRNSQTMQTGNTYTPEPPKGRMCLGIPRGASSSSPHSTAAVFLIESFAESTTFKSSWRGSQFQFLGPVPWSPWLLKPKPLDSWHHQMPLGWPKRLTRTTSTLEFIWHCLHCPINDQFLNILW